MRKKALIMLSVIVLLSSCSMTKVSSDYDKSASFNAYKTYAYTTEAMNIPLNGVSKGVLLDIVDGEMAAKGFTRTEKGPDLFIDIKIKTKNMESVSVNPGLNEGWGYGPGYMYGWSGSFSTSTINFDNYKDGTMFIDMIDASKKQLVWQGRCKKTIDPNANMDQRELNISKAVKQIFSRYPPK